MKTLALLVTLTFASLSYAGEQAPEPVPPAPPLPHVVYATPVMACVGQTCSVRPVVVSRRVVSRTLYRSRVSVRRWRLFR